MIKQTLEKLYEADKAMEELHHERSVLKRDLADLKEGRLDRIEERQKIDSKAGRISTFAVLKIQRGDKTSMKDVSPWYEPYKITVSGNAENTDTNEMEVNNSIVKLNATGSYKLDSGEVRFL